MYFLVEGSGLTTNETRIFVFSL